MKPMSKEKRILLSLLMCWSIYNTAYAEEHTINQDTEWSIDETVLRGGDTVTFTENDATLTMTNNSTNSAIYPVYVQSSDNEGIVITSEKTGNTLVLNDEKSGSSVTAIQNNGSQDIEINNVDLEIKNFKSALYASGDGAITINNNNTVISGAGNGILANGNAQININSADTVTIAASSTGIKAESDAQVNINTTTFELTGSSGCGIETDGSNASVAITVHDITIQGYNYGLYTIEAGDTNVGTIKLINDDSDGSSITIQNCNQGIKYESVGLIDIESNGSVNFTGNYDGISAVRAGGEDSGVKITGSGSVNFINNDSGIFADYNAEKAVTIIGSTKISFEDNHYGIYSEALEGVTITDSKEISFDGSGYSGNSYGIVSYADKGVNISNSDTVSFKGLYEGIFVSAENGVNISNVGKLSFDDSDYNGFGIYSTAIKGVNITNSDEVSFKGLLVGVYADAEDSVNLTNGGEISFTDNTYGIYSMSASNGVNITNVSDITFEDNTYAIRTTQLNGAVITDSSNLTFINNDYGMDVTGGGSLDFTTETLTATSDGATGTDQVVGYASGTGSMIKLTAEKTVISETNAEDDNVAFYAKNGGSITLSTKEIDATRDAGYLAYTDENEASSIEISADSGSITGAFWTEGGTLNLDLGTDTKWTINADSKVTDLTIGDDSALEFAYNNDNYLTLYAANIYSNDGNNSTITMNIASDQNNVRDRIYVDGEHTGTSIILLNNNGHDVSDDLIGTVLVSVNNESGQFTGNTTEGALYWWRYELDSQDSATYTDGDGNHKDWYLAAYNPVEQEEKSEAEEPTPAPTPDDASKYASTTTVDTVVAAGALNYYAFRDNDKLLRRMGELRHNGADEQGAWVRVNGAKIGRHGSFEDKYTHYEIGYDKMTKDDEKGRSYEGVSISYAEGDNTFKYGGGSNHNENVSFYSVDQRSKGQYLDLAFKIGLYANKFDVRDSNYNNITGKTDSVAISANVEYGRKNTMKHDWYFEPQAQLTIGHIGSSEYTTSNDVNVHQGGTNSLVGRVGFNIGKGFGKDDKKGIVYLKANLLREFWGNYGFDMSTETSHRYEHGNYREGWFEYGLGFAYKYNKNGYVYADVERTSGSDYYKNWAWNVGLRWTFN